MQNNKKGMNIFDLNRFLDWTMNLFVWISSNSVQYYEWSLDHSYNHFRQKIQTFMHLDIIRTFSERLDTKNRFVSPFKKKLYTLV